jgi:hypothetical protein
MKGDAAAATGTDPEQSEHGTGRAIGGPAF